MSYHEFVTETGSHGATPEQTLSRVLQDLRDDRVVEFLGRGVYRLTARPIYAELTDLTQPELDDTIRRGLLRFGSFDTSTEPALARRRVGQDRVRALILECYSGQCALCDIRDQPFLVASHIVPWSDDPDARGNLTNVLWLCRLHDALFEAGYWSLTDDLRVVRRSNIASATMRALLPDDIAFRRPQDALPSAEYMSRHRMRHRLGSP